MAGGFIRDIPVAETLLAQIYKNTADNPAGKLLQYQYPLYSCGFLAGIKTPDKKDIVIDCHSYTSRLGDGSPTIAKFGRIYWEGEEVTEVFWERLTRLVKEGLRCLFAAGEIDIDALQETDWQINLCGYGGYLRDRPCQYTLPKYEKQIKRDSAVIPAVVTAHSAGQSSSAAADAKNIASSETAASVITNTP